MTSQSGPSGIMFLHDAIQVDAAIVAGGLGIEASLVPALIRAGSITSLCERGVGEDEGNHRLTFFYQGKRLRLVVDSGGHLVRRSTIDFGARPLPPVLRKSGE